MQFDLKTIGLIVTGVALLAITLAFIFSGKFRKDVIASEGEAAVLGIINVKGVIIVLLIAIFGGLLVFILQLKDESMLASTSDVTVDDAVEILAATDSYSLALKNISPDSVGVEINGTIIREMKVRAAGIKVRRSRKAEPVWEISNLDNRQLGELEMVPHSAYLRIETDTTIDGDKKLKVDKAYGLVNTHLVFRIDTITVDEDGDYNYDMVFGEGSVSSANSIKWKEESLYMERSRNGNIMSLNQFHSLSDPNWEGVYLVGVGLGQPVHKMKNGVKHYYRIDRATVIAFELHFK